MNSGLSKARLGDMHEIMFGHVERGALPGLVSVVSRNGDTYVDTIGNKTVGGRDSMRRDTIFRITSMTKPITAVAAMILVEECKLRLDEPVDRLLPELANRRVLRHIDSQLDDTVPAERRITVRDLLTFKMGFGALLVPPGTYPIQQAVAELGIGTLGPPTPPIAHAPDEWMKRLGSLPLMRQPGEAWLYNTGSYVLGVLIARASGKPFDEFLKERIFDPLAMKDTTFSATRSAVSRLAHAYRFDPESQSLTVLDPAEGSQWATDPTFFDGGAGLLSTADDYFSFAQMMLNRGTYGKNNNYRILSSLSIELMTTDQLTREQQVEAAPFLGANSGWGLGVSVVRNRDSISAVPGRFGWSGGYGTSWFTDPNENAIGILLTQRMWSSPSPPEVVQDFLTSAYLSFDR